MRIFDIFYLAVSNAVTGKLRTIFTLSAVSIGVAAVILVISAGDGGKKLISEQVDKLGIEGITIYVKQSASNAGVTLGSDDAVEVAANVDGIENAMPVIIRYGSYIMRNWRGNAVMYGVDANMRGMMNVELLYGRLPTAQDTRYQSKIAVIDSNFAKEVFGRENVTGKEIQLFLGNQYHTFEIAGIISPQSDVIEELIGESIPKFVYLPYTTVQKLTGSSGIDQLLIRSDDDAVGEKAVSYLNNKYSGDSFKHENISGIRNRLNDIMEMITVFIGAIASVSIFVAGIGVMNTTLSVAVERKKEIGIYMALGATQKMIFSEFLIESALVSAAGGVAGTAISLALLYVAGEIVGISIMPAIMTVIFTVFVATVSGMLFGVLPSVKASQMNPIDALRGE